MTIDMERGGEAACTLSERDKFVLEVSISVATGLRKSAARNNIRQMSDFVNGMIFCGLLMNESDAGEETAFAAAFQRKTRLYRKAFEEGAIRRSEVALAEMAQHSLGVSDMSASDMLITLGLSAEGTIREIGDECGLSASERVDATIATITLAVLSTTCKDKIDTVFWSVEQAIAEKERTWKSFPGTEGEGRGLML